MKRLLVVFLALLMLAGSTGVMAEAKLTDDGVIAYTPYDLSGKTITVYTAEGELSNSVYAQKDRFTELTGCNVEVVAVPMDTYLQKLSIDLASGTSDYDAFAMTKQMEYITNGWLEPLGSYFADPAIADPNLNLDDFIPAQIDHMLVDGKHYGFPWKPDTMIYYYRKDLFGDEANKEAFKAQYGYDLAPAKTWEQYMDIAKFFTKEDGSMYGSLFMGMKLNQLSMCIQSRFFGTGLYWYDENYNTNLNTPEFKKVLESFKWELENTTPPGVENMEWPEANTAFLSGICAQHITWPGLSKMCETPEGDWGKSEVVGKVGYALTPGWEGGKNASTMGGWWASVSALSDEKVAAYKFVEFITSQEGEPLKVSSGCDPARKSNFEMLAQKDSFYDTLSACLDVSIPTPSLNRWSTFDSAFLDIVHGAITGLTPIDDAAAQCDQALNDYLTEEGYK
jgi:multiple sugar transport system substrate-binding protein